VGIGFALEDVKFASDNDKWNIRFMELVEYKDKNGHCNCPTHSGSLGFWIKHQRTLFKSKKLMVDRYEKLVGIGFVFQGFAVDEIWNRRFMELVEYKEKNGDCYIPGTKGGSWISRQRTLFRSKELKEDRYEKLVKIGFAFEDANFANFKTKSEHDEKWNRRFMELVEY
jgi:hypothetical protein